MGKAVLDLREVAEGIIDRAKELLSSEGHFEPVGFVLAMTGEPTCLKLDIRNKEARKNSRRELWALAQKMKAVAVFTVVDCMFRPCRKEDGHEVDALKAGHELIYWQAEPKLQPCIELQISVPGEHRMTVLVPYYWSGDGSLEFDPATENSEDAELSRFISWAQECALQN